MIAKFLRSRIHEYMIFTWIACIRHTLPGASLKEAIKSFRKRFKVTEEDLSDAAILKIWERMNSEYDTSELKTDPIEIGGGRKSKSTP